MRRALLAIVLLLTPTARAEELSWGHLPSSWRLVPGERQFLINWAKDAPYRVCLPRALAERHPTLEAEIDAAANVWARYVGRQITVRFVEKDGPVSGASKEAVRDALTARCAGADLAVSMAPLPGQALGETGFKRTTLVTTRGKTSTTKTETSGRYLLLRDLKTAPVTIAANSPPLAWAGYTELPLVERPAAKTARDLTAQILARLEARDTALYSFTGKMPFLAVLVHELGHIWGLCDLYESDQLCDAKHSGRTRLAPDHFATMGPMLFRQQLFLADDDIAGLRALAARPGFDAGWRTPKAWPRPAPLALPAVEIFTARVAKKERRRVVLAVHAVTNRPARYRIEARRSDGGAWRTVVDEKEARPRLAEPNLSYELQTQDDTDALELRIRLEYETEGGGWSAPQFVVPK